MTQSQLEQAAEKVLVSIRNKVNQIVSVAELSTELGLNIDEIKKTAGHIKQWGYGITLTPTDICLTSIPDTLSDIEIKFHLDTKYIGHKVTCYGSVQSTNDIAKEMAEKGASSGTVVIADQQTKGRGRFGRSWQSPPGCGASISIILRPDFPPENAPGISLIVALALTETLNELCPGIARIKWPNDVLLNGKKTAGILTELAAGKNKIEYMVVGVGININQSPGDFVEEIRSLATSINIATGQKINRAELVGKFLNQFEKEYLEYSDNLLTNSLDRLRNYSSLIGQTLSVLLGKRTITGKAVDINKDGALVIEQNGELIALNCGEVTVVKK